MACNKIDAEGQAWCCSCCKVWNQRLAFDKALCTVAMVGGPSVRKTGTPPPVFDTPIAEMGWLVQEAKEGESSTKHREFLDVAWKKLAAWWSTSDNEKRQPPKGKHIEARDWWRSGRVEKFGRNPAEGASRHFRSAGEHSRETEVDQLRFASVRVLLDEDVGRLQITVDNVRLRLVKIPQRRGNIHEEVSAGNIRDSRLLLFDEILQRGSTH
eukprot:CAMPEP_0206624882 /NCGR_PEP_ID=MMETSP0325_2-20121206/64437_1 /ASSEMBLY_ACC=CAM_ASM_000347 /TAXON_ID=2866 /ORGANISM="Crypthecodinium cohnii, Strain Seligo" /LENGTH=211 /DNA_ID=CAMNT_0054149025 /DNA_START=190 /DNA_END=827 /DNA_ORIENTATION=-